jgi:hypothetical protein
MKTGPRPARTYCAPRARPPCGPKLKTARRPARAQRVPCVRPQPGPRPGKSRPAWAATLSARREPSICIQRPCTDSGRTKPGFGALAQTLGFICAFSCRAALRSPPRAVSPARAPADGWTRRRRVAPRQSRTRVDLDGRARRSTSDAEEDGAAAALSLVCAPANGWTCRCRAAHRWCPARTAMAGPKPAAASGSSRSTHAARRS